jgi:hypothetical protein
MARLGKRRFYLLVFLLVLGVAGIEVPELFSLADDVSNDAELVEYLHKNVPGPCCCRSTREARSPESRRLLSPGNLESFPSHLRFASSAKSGQDILHLLTLQRK